MKYFRLIISQLVFMFFLVSCSDHSVKLTFDDESYFQGDKGSVAIKLAAYGKWKIDPKSLITINYTAPKGITMDVNEFFSDNHEMNTVFRTGFKVSPDAPKGNAEIKADVFFMICSKSLCKMIKEEQKGSVLIR